MTTANLCLEAVQYSWRQRQLTWSRKGSKPEKWHKYDNGNQNQNIFQFTLATHSIKYALAQQNYYLFLIIIHCCLPRSVSSHQFGRCPNFVAAILF